MSSKATIQLDYKLKHIESYGDIFILCYKAAAELVDIFDRHGKRISRINIKTILSTNQLELQSVSFLKFPWLVWSDRKVEDTPANTRSAI